MAIRLTGAQQVKLVGYVNRRLSELGRTSGEWDRHSALSSSTIARLVRGTDARESWREWVLITAFDELETSLEVGFRAIGAPHPAKDTVRDARKIAARKRGPRELGAAPPAPESSSSTTGQTILANGEALAKDALALALRIVRLPPEARRQLERGLDSAEAGRGS